MTETYDLVILGGGTAGYVGGIRASQLGMKVAIVEQEKLGGTCLHKGCIPTKSLLKSAEVFRYIQNAEHYGLHALEGSFDFGNIQERKNGVVNQMFKGIQHLMKSNKIDVYEGTGTILGPSIFSPQAGTVSVTDSNGESTLLVNKHVLICTGSKPRELDFLPFDEKYILSSDDMMVLQSLPQSMAIIGGGVIGLEFASLLNDLGVEIHVLEAGSEIIPMEEKKIAKHLKQALSKKGINFITNAKINKDNIVINNGVTFNLEQSIKVEKVLVAIGRAPNSSEIGLQNTKIRLDNGFIETDEFYQTKDNHIYAVGDVIGGLQLAHVASKEAIIAVEHMNEIGPVALDYDSIPKCIYTSPEVASVGKTVAKAQEEGIDVLISEVPFQAIGKAVVEGDATGKAVLITDKSNGDIVGLSMIGPKVTELINEVAFAKFMDASAIEMGSAVHAHPSLSEILMEVGLKSDGHAIHI